jgi:2-oxoglutarate dehydrogenase complex dehydrogenase (E1) component-like enzyme
LRRLDSTQAVPYFNRLIKKVTEFKRVIGETMPDTLVIPEQIKTVVLCSGQFYYDIVERRSKEGIKVFFKLRIWL